MNFSAAGVFEIKRQKNRHVDVSPRSKKEFWSLVEKEYPGLRHAAGCYVFVTFNSRSAVPWYVGKAERQSFEKEVFALHKVHHYNEVLASQKGTPYVFLIPRVKASRVPCKPTRAETPSIRLLEMLLIGMALRRNPQLRNTRDTSLLRKLNIEGLLNSKIRGRPGTASLHLRKALSML